MPVLKFGLVLPYGTARFVAQLSQLAEQAGWDGCFLGDAIWCEDPMIALAAAAMTTQRIRLGTMVILMPLRRPWKLASESVALDRCFLRAVAWRAATECQPVRLLALPHHSYTNDHTSITTHGP